MLEARSHQQKPTPLAPCRRVRVPCLQVGDLGLSKIKKKTMCSGGVRGTLPWMAPELLDGNSHFVTEKVSPSPVPGAQCLGMHL